MDDALIRNWLNEAKKYRAELMAHVPQEHRYAVARMSFFIFLRAVYGNVVIRNADCVNFREACKQYEKDLRAIAK